MAFTTWCDLLTEAKNALASGEIERFMKSTIENHREMRVAFRDGSTSWVSFISWLEAKCSEELYGGTDHVEGGLNCCVLGGDG